MKLSRKNRNKIRTAVKLLKEVRTDLDNEYWKINQAYPATETESQEYADKSDDLENADDALLQAIDCAEEV